MKIWEEEVAIPIYVTGQSDKNNVFEKRVYLGSSGKMCPTLQQKKISHKKRKYGMRPI
ncbi:MAG: hypothetical protein KHZ72_04275 [Lachnospiraceae bacterium]|nr:hypothetical protein [Lachnospiraceae bacterium]